MKSKNEKQLLKLIKYTPLILIFLFSIFVIIFTYIDQNAIFQTEKNSMKKEYITINKEKIKEIVNRACTYTNKTFNNTEKKLKESLKKEVLNAHAIAMNIYKQNADKSEEDVKKMIINALRPIRFNKTRGYLFIYETDGKNILNAGFPNLEGKSLWNYQDLKGTFLLQEMKEILSNSDETFYDWYWEKPDDNESKEVKKIGFFKKFTPYNWFIGTGEYLEDFEVDVKENILTYLRELRYGKNGYIFVFDYDGNSLVHLNKKIENRNYKEFKENKQMYSIGKKVVDTGKKGESFLQYEGIFNPNKKNLSMKTVYIKNVPNLKWIIGTGFYEDELYEKINNTQEKYEKRFEKYIQDMLIIASILTIIFLFLSIYITSLLEKKFITYRKEIDKHIKDNTRQQNILAYQSRMAGMGEMIGNIAHQWRQPLSNILTVTSGMKLKKELGILEDKELNESFDQVANTIKYLSGTIDDFRNFFKPDKKFKKCLAQDIFKKVMTLLSAQFKAHDIEIVSNIDFIEFQTIENELIQVLINIFNNAKDELLDKDSKKLIFIDMYEKDKKIFISIKDNAGGVPENIKDKIFEPYFTTKKDKQGTGIGLYMSKEIVVKHLKGKFYLNNETFKYDEKQYKSAVFTIELDKEEEI